MGGANKADPIRVGHSVIKLQIIRSIISKRMRWAAHVARMEEGRCAYRVLVRKPEGKRPHGRPRRRWEENFKKGLQEVVCGDMDWIDLAQDRVRRRVLVNAVMNLPGFEIKRLNQG